MAVSDQMPTSQLYNMIQDWVSAATSGATVMLFNSNITPTATTKFSDVSPFEVSGSWYTRQNAVYNQAYDLGNGSMQLTLSSIQWNYSGTSPIQTVYGYAVLTASPYSILHSNRLDTPVSMQAIPDAVIVQPQLTLAGINATGSDF